MKKLVKLFIFSVFITLIGSVFVSCPEGPPVLTGTVSITGTAEVGQTLTVNTSNLGGSGVITFQWIRDGSTVIGSGSTYIIQTADVGSTITVNVTRADNSGSITSSPIIVANQNPVASDFDVDNLTQYAGNVTAVTITPKTGKSTGVITIFYNGSTTLPTVAGTYAITFNIAASTGWNAATGLAIGTLIINNQTPVASDYDIGNLTQFVGSVVPVTITPKEGKSSGGIIIYYDGLTTLPTATGTYAVTFYVLPATGWNAASDLIGGTLTINNQTPISADYNINNLTQIIGSVVPVVILPKENKSTGAITVFYNGSTTLPTIAGTYTITFNVESTTGWNEATGLVGGTLTIANTGIIFDSSVKLYLNGSLLVNGGITTLSQGTGTFNVSIPSGTYTEIIWFVNGNITAQGAERTSITLSKQISGVYQITVEATLTGSGSVKNSGSHNFVVQ